MEATTIHQRDILSRDELRALIDQPASLCVSLFLPIERAALARQPSST